jgi:uncharacterized protein YggE
MACTSGTQKAVEQTNPVELNSGVTSETRVNYSDLSGITNTGQSQQSGIWVTGKGKVTLEPDLALLDMVVEASSKSVEKARYNTATSMNKIVTSLKALGIQDKDIQTRSFNISPQYVWEEVVENGRRHSKQILTGYQVTHSVQIKIRELDEDLVGIVIDQAVTDGGDNIRINNIQFTIENSYAAQNQARALAIEDGLAKAQLFAGHTGVTRGSLVFITENNITGIEPRTSMDFARAGMALESDTHISSGELEVQASVQMIFNIGD